MNVCIHFAKDMRIYRPELVTYFGHATQLSPHAF